jgi:DNA replication and repair protein RecF
VTLRRLELADFRLFRAAVLSPAPEGTTVITGANGTGKTSLLEAYAYLGTHRSFRGAPVEALVRDGATRGYVRAELVNDGAPTSVDAELVAGGRSRTLVNRKPSRARRDTAAAAPCTVFSPEDLSLIAGGPKGRRDLLDDALALLDPEGARAADDVERVLRQRGALLRQMSGRANPGPDVLTTLDVWDQRLSDAAKILVAARERLVSALAPGVASVYERLAGTGSAGKAAAPSDSAASNSIASDSVGARSDGSEAWIGGPGSLVAVAYQRSWEGDLHAALAEGRTDDLRRGVNTVGPHRDDLVVRLDGRTARMHASQGEQRCLALALRLSLHSIVRERTNLRPTLLLDDVFSELDPARSRALVAELPTGQAILTTAAPVPAGVTVASLVEVDQLVSS